MICLKWITHELLSIDIPVDAVAYEIQVNYTPGILIIATPAENSEIQLTDINDKEGIFTYMGSLDEICRITLPLQVSGQNAAISVSVQALDCDNQILGQSTQRLLINNIPKEYALYQNFPNPFNPITVIEYDIPKDSHVHLALYDMLVRKVKTLTYSYQELGYKSIQWDGTDENGISLGSGMYFYSLNAESYSTVKKMVLLK